MKTNLSQLERTSSNASPNTQNSTLQDNLRSVRLTYLLENSVQAAEQAAGNGNGHLQYLQELVAVEVALAIGQNSDVTAEAAGVVVNHCTKLALHPFKSNHHGIPYDLLGISYTVTHLDQYCPVRHSICRFFRA